MGNMHAYEAATTMTDMVGLHAALDYHLTSNHYPPVPRSMIPVCIEAISKVADAYDDYGDDGVTVRPLGYTVEEVQLPEGVTYLDRDTAPALQIVEAHHLDAFVEAELERRRDQ